MDYLSLCLICKDENDYLAEWLDYHILMGVDRFYIYDNESQVSLRESLIDYIERGWVVVVDIPGKAMQLYAYDHCLQNFGAYTRWMGFIDADEFLVPKTTLDLKGFMKNYEAYGGLAVSSLFFGSNGHKTRPAVGQIDAYTRRTHTTFKGNELVKSIVQPELVLMPSSPHDFTFKKNTWCVNEGLLRVDGQRFPNYTDKIQLNHYFCRSEREIDLKLRRGNSGSVTWPRKRFDVVNLMSAYEDTSIIQNLEALFLDELPGSDGLSITSVPSEAGLLEKMAVLASTRRRPELLGITLTCETLSFRVEFSSWMGINAQKDLARSQGDFYQVCQMMLRMIQVQPQYTGLYIDLAINYLNINDPALAWQALTYAWQLAPKTYMVLVGMVLYFLWVKDYSMAEKTCHILLDIAPHNLMVLGHLTEALIGQERYEEALNVGVPVVELSATVGELPEGMGVFLVKKMAEILLKKKNYASVVRLWQAGVKCQPGDVYALIELSQALLLAGDKNGARQQLIQAQQLAPENVEVLALIKQVGAFAQHPTPVARRLKRY